MREEWIEALISQGEDADYLEKLSNKEIYRVFMGQQCQLATKKRAEEKEKTSLLSIHKVQILPPSQQPSKKKTKPTITLEDSREIIVWFYNNQDKWFEVFRGKEELKRSVYKSVDEVLQLPDSDLRKMMELGEAHKKENEGGRHLLLVIKHHFNPSKDVIIDAKPF
ncbi:hypothetical protein L1987_09146 [Smallanthus sonchifolius]|uniref:Uncharacterized protein n=1 Tax=Smallanthus sonchifolius TaxID=185202 RepID=A0ACB9JNP5_9ASTR|nr:hypothetical protein L1987_09146 [Smallanthus sonchifolius]